MQIERGHIPSIILERSLAFKTAVLITAAIIILGATLLRPHYPLLIWGSLFIAGGLLEWVIVLTVYVEMQELEAEIEETYEKTKQAERDIIESQDQIETAWNRIQGMMNEMYDIQGSGENFNTLEPGGHVDPEHVDLDHEPNLEERVRKLEQKIESKDRG